MLHLVSCRYSSCTNQAGAIRHQFATRSKFKGESSCGKSQSWTCISSKTPLIIRLATTPAPPSINGITRCGSQGQSDTAIILVKRQSSAAVATRRQSPAAAAAAAAPDRPCRCQKSSICHGQDPIRSAVCLLASQTITKKPRSRPTWRLPQVLPWPRRSNHIPHRPSGPGNPSPAPATAPAAKQLKGIPSKDDRQATSQGLLKGAFENKKSKRPSHSITPPALSNHQASRLPASRSLPGYLLFSSRRRPVPPLLTRLSIWLLTRRQSSPIPIINWALPTYSHHSACATTNHNQGPLKLSS